MYQKIIPGKLFSATANRIPSINSSAKPIVKSTTTFECRYSKNKRLLTSTAASEKSSQPTFKPTINRLSKSLAVNRSLDQLLVER